MFIKANNIYTTLPSEGWPSRLPLCSGSGGSGGGGGGGDGHHYRFDAIVVGGVVMVPSSKANKQKQKNYSY